MEIQQYKFWLRRDAEAYYRVDHDATSGTYRQVVIDGDRNNGNWMQHAVKNWDQMGFGYKRSGEFFGMFQQFNPKRIGFVLDAATILRHVYTTEDINGEVALEVWVLNSTFGYDLLDVYSIDMMTFVSYELYAEAEIFDQGPAAAIDAYKEVQYEIALPDPADDAGVSWIYMDGTAQVGQYNYQLYFHNQSIDVDDSVSGNQVKRVVAGTGYLNTDGSYDVGTATAAVLAGIDFFAIGRDQQFFKVVLDGGNESIVLDGFKANIQFQTQIGISPRNHLLQLYVYFFSIDTGGTATNLGSEQLLWQSNGGSYVADGTNLYVIPSNEVAVPGVGVVADVYYCLVWRYSVDVAVPSGHFARCTLSALTDLDKSNAKVAVKFQYVAPGSFCRAMRANELFKRLVAKMGGSVYGGAEAADSAFFTDTTAPSFIGDLRYDLVGNQLWVTCGDALRELYLDSTGGTHYPKIVTSFIDFAKFAFRACGMGIGVATIGGVKKVVCERLDYFYSPDTTTVLAFNGAMKDLTVEPYNVQRAGLHKMGYPEVTLDAVNARYDAWSDQDYRSPLNTRMPDRDMQVPYSASPFEIEYTRNNLANKKTNDSAQDNKVFLLVSQPNSDEIGDRTCYLLNRAWTAISGVPTVMQNNGPGGVFNVELTPARCLLRLMPFLTSNYTGLLVNTLFELTRATKNTTFYSKITYDVPECLEEYTLRDYQPIRLWEPILVSFETAIPLNNYRLMVERQYEQYSVNVNGVYVRGFLMEYGVMPGRQSSNIVKLLLAPGESVTL